MSKHFIYEIPGLKIGATVNLWVRINLYLSNDTDIIGIHILQIIHDKTDEEVTEIERGWQRRLGYPLDKMAYHQSRAYYINMIRSGYNAAVKVGFQIKGNIARNKLLNNPFKTGSAQIASVKSSKHNTKQLLKCPHCGITGIGPVMNRWHFNNCSKIQGSVA